METTNTPIYEAFEWSNIKETFTVPGHVLTKQVNNVRDIAGGVGVILGMLERDALAQGDGESPILNIQDAATLLRHSIRCMEVLGVNAERLCDWAHEHAEPKH